MAYPYGSPPDVGGSHRSTLKSQHEVEPHYSGGERNYCTSTSTSTDTTATNLHPRQLGIPDDLLFASWFTPSEQDYYEIAGASGHADDPPSVPLPSTQTDQSIGDFAQQFHAKHAIDVFAQAGPWHPGHRLGHSNPTSDLDEATDNASGLSTSLIDESHLGLASNGTETLDGSITDVDPTTTEQSSKKSVKTCELCGINFTGRYRRGNYSRHFRQRHAGQCREPKASCTCRICKKSFKRQDARRKHEWKQHQLSDAKPYPRRDVNKEEHGFSNTGTYKHQSEPELSLDTRTLPSDSDFIHSDTQVNVNYQTSEYQHIPHHIFATMDELPFERYLRPGASSVHGEGLPNPHNSEHDADYTDSRQEFREINPADEHVEAEIQQDFTAADHAAHPLIPDRPPYPMAQYLNSDSSTRPSNRGYAGSYFSSGVPSAHPSNLESPNTSFSSAFNHDDFVNQLVPSGYREKIPQSLSDYFEGSQGAVNYDDLMLSSQDLEYYPSSIPDTALESEKSLYYHAA